MTEASEHNHLAPLSVGDKVPDIDFSMFYKGNITTTSFKNFKDRWLIVFFYPADFTFVCPTELGDLADNYDKFVEEKAEIISVSPDSVWSHKVWHETSKTINKIKFPMVADVKDDLSKRFGTYCEDGTAHRGTFLVSPDGEIKSVEINDPSIGRSSTELLRKLKAARHVTKNEGMVCPMNWQEGDEALKPGMDLVGKI